MTNNIMIYLRRQFFVLNQDNGATRTSHSHIRDPKSVGIATTLMLLRAMGFYVGVRLIIRLTELLHLICSMIYDLYACVIEFPND